jgi:predicted O-methyltransferase YrrM
MIKRSTASDAVERYVTEVISRETPLQKRLSEETAADPMARMQIGPDQAAFLAMLVRITGARRAIEIGTFYGYSALAVASALPDDGTLIACDVNQEWTSVGRRYWKEAGVDRKIDLRLAPAVETLNILLREGAADGFDFAFIDADKENYDLYYEACLKLVRPGGLIALDNMLWHGSTAGPPSEDPETRILQQLNLKIRDDARVDACLVTIGDGVMLARRR